MKKYTAYLVLAAGLLAVGLLALVASFAVYLLPGMLTNPALTVGQALGQTVAVSLALFGAGSAALYGQRRAFEAAHARQMEARRVQRP